MGLWGTDLDAVLPSALPKLPRSARGLGAIEREAMDRRVDLAVARLEAEALARSFGLTRTTRLVNVLDLGGTSKTQKDKGQPSAGGGGFNLAFEVPLYDFGRARVREAEQRYFEALNALAAKVVNARSEAREAYGAYQATYAVAAQYEHEVLPLRDTISAETELQYNAMQIDAFALLDAARAKAAAQVAAIEAKRNFWLASADLGRAWRCKPEPGPRHHFRRQYRRAGRTLAKGQNDVVATKLPHRLGDRAGQRHSSQRAASVRRHS